MYYIFQTENDFGFKCDEVHDITETDVEISDELHQQFLDEQSQGKSFRLKNINGITFEEIFEEYVPAHEETREEKLFRLEKEYRETDHRLVRCYECKLFNEGTPCGTCNIEELHQQRIAIRTEIESLRLE